MQSTKEKVLKLLLCHKNEYLSGENIGAQLFLSRNAVWKGIKALIADGYNIKAVRNKGYLFVGAEDILSAEGILSYVRERDFFDLSLYKSLGSTNDLMKQEISNNAKNGRVIVACEQTAGKGRRGRNFYSPSGTGIYFSLLLCPEFSASEMAMLTSMAAVAVCRAIEKISDKKPEIKWVNDIYIGGKKVCGILSEATFTLESGYTQSVVLGFGVNIYEPEKGFPADIKHLAGALLQERGQDVRNRLIAEILNECIELYKNFSCEEIASEYKKRSFVIGKNVFVLKGENKLPAHVLDINSENQLVARFENGKIEALNSGEISLKL